MNRAQLYRKGLISWEDLVSHSVRDAEDRIYALIPPYGYISEAQGLELSGLFAACHYYDLVKRGPIKE